MAGVLERAARLRSRRPDDPHPFVDEQGFRSWLDELERNAEKKLREERPRSLPPGAN